MEFSTNVEPSYAEAAAKVGQAATTPRGKRTPKQLEAMCATAEATKNKTGEKAKQREKEREEKQRQKQREEKEREEKWREEQKRDEEEKRREEKRQREDDEKGHEREKSERNGSRRRKKKKGEGVRMIVIVAETVIGTGRARAIATRVNMGVTTTIIMTLLKGQRSSPS